jgi:hypothetical protein
MFAALLLVALATPSGPGASTFPAPQGVATPGPFAPGYRSACIRSLGEFAYALSSAVESGDVNRLASLYRWRGQSTREGYDTMTRLQAIVARPLLDVAPVYPEARAPPPPASTASTASVLPRSAGTGAAAPSAADPKVFPPLTGPPMFEVPLPDDSHATGESGPGASSGTGADPAGHAPPRSPPVGLRLDQTLANGVTPATTTLRLQRELGCWWVSL